jgi:hypothetical protein
MAELRYTLLGDGSSDRRLLPVITWVLQQHTTVPIAPSWANFGFLRERPCTLRDRAIAALEYYAAPPLLIHRDAEAETREQRIAEIAQAVRGLGIPDYVCVIPVRMQEAWLLFDESAIRQAAGNPNGRQPLSLPSLHRVELVPNPKEVLFQALRDASELGARRLAAFNPAQAAHRVAELIDDYSPLRQLAAFATLEGDLRAAIARLMTAPMR